MNYYPDEEIDIRVRRGRVSPAIAPRPTPRRPAYYESRTRELRQIGGRIVERSRSRARSPSPAPAPASVPISINNYDGRVYNQYEEEEFFEERRRVPEAPRVWPGPPSEGARERRERRERNRRRDRMGEPGYRSREDYELERTRKELEILKLEARREEDEKLLKKELEYKRLKEEKKAEEKQDIEKARNHPSERYKGPESRSSLADIIRNQGLSSTISKDKTQQSNRNASLLAEFGARKQSQFRP